jgi:hypothetical protein
MTALLQALPTPHRDAASNVTPGHNINAGGNMKRKPWGFLLPLPLAAVLIFVAACDTARIGDINRDPGRYSGKDITIAGEVVNSFGLLGEGAFELDDGTGRIWVLSEGYGVPGQGARVSVTGRVVSGVTIGGRSIANALKETRRRHTAS